MRLHESWQSSAPPAAAPLSTFTLFLTSDLTFTVVFDKKSAAATESVHTCRCT